MIGEIFIAIVANVLALHAGMLARHIHIALIAPEVTVIIVAVGHLLVT